MYDLEKYHHRSFPVGGRTVVWFFDEEERDASKFQPDNLFILDENGKEVWSLGGALGREDTCVLLRVEDGAAYFTTFNGFSARVDVLTLDLTRRHSQR